MPSRRATSRVALGQIVAAAPVMLAAGKNLVIGLFNGIVAWAPRLWEWFTGLPGRIWNVLSGAHEPSPTGFLIPPRASVPLTDGTGWRLVFPKAFGTASGTLYAVCADA